MSASKYRTNRRRAKAKTAASVPGLRTACRITRHGHYVAPPVGSITVMSHDAIRLGDSNDFVEIELLDRGTVDGQNEGDLRLGVSVRNGTFAGSYDQVWIAKDQWSCFLGSMRRLERDRSGQSSLVSMSPEEFELHLQVVDRAGHLAAHGCLSRYHFGHPSGKTTRSRIEYHMPVDPSLLRELVLSLERLGQSAV